MADQEEDYPKGTGRHLYSPELAKIYCSYYDSQNHLISKSLFIREALQAQMELEILSKSLNNEEYLESLKSSSKPEPSLDGNFEGQKPEPEKAKNKPVLSKKCSSTSESDSILSDIQEVSESETVQSKTAGRASSFDPDTVSCHQNNDKISISDAETASLASDSSLDDETDHSKLESLRRMDKKLIDVQLGSEPSSEANQSGSQIKKARPKSNFLKKFVILVLLSSLMLR